MIVNLNIYESLSVNTEAELLHTYSKVDPLDTLILCVRLAVLVAVTLTVPVVLFPVMRLFIDRVTWWHPAFLVYISEKTKPCCNLLSRCKGILHTKSLSSGEHKYFLAKMFCECIYCKCMLQKLNKLNMIAIYMTQVDKSMSSEDKYYWGVKYCISRWCNREVPYTCIIWTEMGYFFLNLCVHLKNGRHKHLGWHEGE